MPAQKPQVYEGDCPYIFVSYSHVDGAAMPIIRALVDEGYRVWYDDGIQAGSSFPDYIADRLHDCSCVLMLVSRSSLTSGWCRNEVEYALDLGRPVLPVYLEDVELTRAMHMRLGSVQALYWHLFATEDEFNEKLFSVRVLDSCLGFSSRKNRGVPQRLKSQARSSGLIGIEDAYQEDVEPRVELPIAIDDVRRKDALVNYTWTELKKLSYAIATADSDDEGLAIAREYSLLDESGRLRGDKKPFVLKDGTRTSVRILGFRHDELANGGKAGISFEFVDVPAMHAMNAKGTNAGGWDRSDLRRWLSDSFFPLLPESLKPNIVSVHKKTNNVGKISSKNSTSVVSDTIDKMWLLSISEIYGELSIQSQKMLFPLFHIPWSSDTYDAEGVQYQLFVDNGVTTTNYAFCRKCGVSTWWWLRSPRGFDSSWFLCVNEKGDWHCNDARKVFGVSPGFCL